MTKHFFIKIFFLFAVILINTGFRANAQDAATNHFIYIQAKNKKPFYVILNNKVYSSSDIGYLIIPKLKSGTYKLQIGFPQKPGTEQEYKCTVNDADVGYSLQTDGNGNLGLLDLQSQSFVAAANDANSNNAMIAANNASDNSSQQPAANPDRSVAFGDMLSSAANDSTLKQAPVPVQQPVAEQQPKATMQTLSNVQETTATQQSDSFSNNPEQDAKTIVAEKKNEILKVGNIDNADQTYGVIKSSENTSSDGQQMTFVLFNNNSTDTVQVLIPQPQPIQNNVSDNQPATPQSTTANSSDNKSIALFNNSNGETFLNDNNADNSQQSSKRRRKKSSDDSDNNSSSNIDISNSVNNPYYKGTDNSTANAGDSNQNNSGQESNNTAPCDNPLSDKDVQKAQKKMIGKGNDDDMLAIADKAINGKCLTTQQVKQLGSLFLSDAGRFAVYQDAYPGVSDKDNYGSLQNQLLDTDFKKRFLNMIKNQ